MAKKVVWLLVSCLMALSLVIASCSSGDSESDADDTNTDTPANTETETGNNDEEYNPDVIVAEDMPQYGGTLTLLYTMDIMGFDEATAPDYWDVAGHITHDELLEGDWAKGPAGTNEFSWKTNDVYRWDSKSGALAESFEILDPGHMIFHIRQGVHYALNEASEASKLVNGREMTGEDVYWNINRWLTAEGSQVARSARTMAEAMEVNLIDDWTIEITVPVEESIYLASYVVDWCSVYPPEVIETYGNMNEWENSVGTGPYYITDYTRSSAVTFQRNTNYWQTDPVGPGKGNQLPYVDTVKYLIIGDVSTQEAAIRSGKVDAHYNLSLDSIKNITQNTDDIIVSQQVPAATYHIAGHTDDPSDPFSKTAVRQALTMAIDYDTIIEELYEGKAVLPSFPITPEPELADAFITLENAPDTIKEIYTYNPEKAKELLAEAGYPDGFSATITCVNTNVDYLSVVSAMWSQVGVDLKINPVENGNYNSMWASRTYEGLFYTLAPSSGTYVRGLAVSGSSVGGNLSFVDDPRVAEAKAEMLTAFAAGDQAQVDAIYRELLPYMLEQSWQIPSPAAYTYTAWWPWVKGYNGEVSPGICNEFRWSKYVWVDETLKQEMGY